MVTRMTGEGLAAITERLTEKKWDLVDMSKRDSWMVTTRVALHE